MNGMILSHIPLHSDSMGRFGTNIHGHTHANRVKQARGVDARTGEVLYSDKNDVRYHCVCVEQTPDFAPILFEDVIKNIEAEGGSVGFKSGNGPTM
jgi:calcineurin-like phosphoesterase family protein